MTFSYNIQLLTGTKAIHRIPTLLSTTASLRQLLREYGLFCCIIKFYKSQHKRFKDSFFFATVLSLPDTEQHGWRNGRNAEVGPPLGKKRDERMGWMDSKFHHDEKWPTLSDYCSDHYCGSDWSETINIWFCSRLRQKFKQLSVSRSD